MIDLSKGTNESRLTKLEEVQAELVVSNNQMVQAIASILEALSSLLPPVDEEDA
jgi:hypothetical protein